MFGSCCVPFSKKREMETRSDCARRRRVGLAADTQFVVKLSGECWCKWLDVLFDVATVGRTWKMVRFFAAVVDLVNSLMLAMDHGSRWILFQYRTYTTKRRARSVRTPIPYIGVQTHLEGSSHGDVKLLRKIHLETESDWKCQWMVKSRFTSYNLIKMKLNNTVRSNISIR